MSSETAIKVEYCLVTWVIENFSVGPWKENTCINSHEFAVSTTSPVNWNLQFYPNEKCNGRHCVSFYLYRVSTDTGPESVMVRFRIKILKEDDTWWEDENECSFKKNEKFGFKNITTLETILGTHGSDVLNNDSLTIQYEILIKPSKQSEVKKEAVTENCASLLSKDMKDFYEKKKMCDLSWRVDGKDIEVHKAVLSARSSVFSVLFDKSDDKVNLPDVGYDAINSFFSFLYSGDLNDILNKPLLGLYECAEYFSVTELEQVATPDRLSVLTNIDSEECEFKWIIENFSKTTQQCISSMSLNKGTSKMAVWKLTFYPKGKSGTQDRVGIFAEVVEGTKSLQVSLKISLLDSFGNSHYTMNTISATSAEGVIGFPSFVKREILRREKNNLLTNDSLRIYCNIKYSTGSHVSKLGKHELTSVNAGFQGNDFKTLSGSLYSLYKSGKFSDVILEAQDRKFKVHRFILAARSSVFECMFEHEMQEKQKGVVPISDIYANILEIMLKYLYSGRIYELTPDTALGLYPAAEKYALQQLKDACSKFLRTNLQVDTVCNVLALADLHNDSDLKKEAMKFVCSNAESVFMKEEWKILENRKKHLTLQVFESLSKGYRNALLAAPEKTGDSAK